MDCAEARDLLHALRRGGEADRRAVDAHLQGCAGCRSAEAAEAALDQALMRLARHAAPPELRRRLRRLSAEATGRTRPRRLSPGVAAATALAAAVLLALGVFALSHRPAGGDADVERLATEAVNDHLRVLVAQRPLEIEGGGPHQVKPWFEGRLDFAPSVPEPDVPDLRLRGGAVGYFLDRKAAVVSYALRRHQVTLLAFEAGGLPWPSPDVELGSVPARVAAQRGFHAFFWRAGDLGYALVSDVNPEELAALAARIAPATRDTPPAPP
jgi:anti-sigma factor RsiW